MMWSMRWPQVAAVPGGTENRRMLAVDRQQRRAASAHRVHEELATDDQRLLCWPAAAACLPAPPPDTAAGRRRRRWRPSRRRPPRGHLLQRGRAGQHVGGQTIVAQALGRAPSSAVASPRSADASARTAPPACRHGCVRGQREDLVAVGVTGQHVERVRADRAGRAEHGDAVARCVSGAAGAFRNAVMRDQGQAPADTPAAGHRCGRARRRGRAAAHLLSFIRHCASSPGIRTGRRPRSARPEQAGDDQAGTGPPAAAACTGSACRPDPDGRRRSRPAPAPARQPCRPRRPSPALCRD